MKSNTSQEAEQVQSNFDLFRISKGKKVVDISENTLRAYGRQGLPLYRCGKSVFISKAELNHFLRSWKGNKAARNPQ